MRLVLPIPLRLMPAAWRWVLGPVVIVLAGLWAGLAAGLPAQAETAPVTTIEVIGDSQAQGLAAALQRRYMRDEHYRVFDRSKIATGIALRPNFDWPTAAKALAAEHHAQYVVIMFGANDRPPIRRNGQIDPALAEKYRQLYDMRVREIIRAFRDAGVEIIWVGHPVVRDNVYTEDMKFLDRIFETAAADEGARYVTTWDLFTTLDGGYTAYGKGLDGMTQRLRADDGVHFTAAGYDVVASRVEPLIEAHRAMLDASATGSR